jgi:hypothetical protein
MSAISDFESHGFRIAAVDALEGSQVVAGRRRLDPSQLDIFAAMGARGYEQERRYLQHWHRFSGLAPESV